MNRKQRALFVSILATSGMLAFLFSSWMKQTPSVASVLESASKAHHIICTGPAGASRYLAEVKPPYSDAGAAGVTAANCTSIKLPHRMQQRFDAVTRIAANVSRPLWLINRSLLI